MAISNLNYFICTLGQAAQLREQDNVAQNTFKTVLTLIEEQAKSFPDQPALGFANFIKSKDPSLWPPSQVTFSELYNLSKYAALIIADALYHPVRGSKPPIVGLLCTSSLNFILAWLGLVRIGFKVFLLAPQLDRRSIQHLCEISGIKSILVDDVRRQKDLQLPESIDIIEIPSFRCNYNAELNGYNESMGETDIAYLRHTSGTSSGLPKEIVQTQWGATGCLPSFQRSCQTATFSTTPLYHGGLTDCFRAWASGAMIWFFPEGVVPITGSNIVDSITYARDQSSVPVNYFSSVPYVLQLLADEREGIHILQSMDLVGVGGAALAPSIGDRLVDLDINLVSRMGSSECGFLMSSHRDYSKDKEWQYLRPIVNPRFLSFEPRNNGLSELVVKPGWPLLSKTNRDDGSYATADLFEPHPSIPNAWRYHSRSDAQITLANGKKFDPSPLEDAMKASTRLVKDVFIFGAGKDYPGALLFKNSNGISDQEVVNTIFLQVKKLNAEMPSHSRLARSMLIIVEPKEAEEPLPKSSKGTILRHQAENQYVEIIQKAYEGKSTTFGNPCDISDGDLYSAIPKLFSQVLGNNIDPHQDFFQQGVDSIACVQVRKLIESSIMGKGSPKLPVNIIYDSGNVNLLVKNLIRIREGGDLSGTRNDTALMSQLVSKYSKFPRFVPGDRRSEGEVILLTGTTGSLGAHILSQVASLPKVKKIYCLVRASTAEEAQSRVIASLESRRIFHPTVKEKAICLPSDFSQESLGLDPLTFNTLRLTVTTVVHSAWMVNFKVGLGSFERSHIAGLSNLIKLCLSVHFQTPAKLFFISSISAAAAVPAPGTIREVHIEDIHHTPNTGYAKSKLVAEHIIHEVARSSGIYAKVLRTGQLMGDAENGLWNPTEAIPLMLQSATTIGALPMLDETPSWLPVDKCASAVLELSGLAHNFKDRRPKTDEKVVYHVLNPMTFSWTNELLPALKEAGLQFKTVPLGSWVKRLQEGEQDPEKNPTVKLLDFYVEKYCNNKGPHNELAFETRTTAEHSNTIRQGFDVIGSGILQKCLENWRLIRTKRQ